MTDYLHYAGRRPGIGVLSGPAWLCAQTWLRVRLGRVNEPLLDSRAVALVAETDMLPYGLTEREVDVLTGIAKGCLLKHVPAKA